MIFAEVEINGVCAHAVRKRIIPAGIVGAQVSFSFTDPKWDNLTKTVVFKGFGTRDVILEGDTVRIPQEVVSRKDVRLLVGVYGTDAENAIAIPTLWADLGTVRNAADPSGEEAADPTLPIWATLKAEIDKLKENGASDEQISKAVEDYLRKNVDLTGYATQQWVQDGYQPKGEYLESTQLAAAVEEALAQAKKSGEFDGEPGYTPKKGIDYFDGKDGYTPVKGVDYFDGDDYVLTDADKTEIAEQAAALVEVPGGGIAVTGATVGQTVKISAVDENGVPTAWESVEFPSGGGSSGDVWEEITRITVAEDLASITITEDANGLPFKLKKAVFFLRLKGNAPGLTGWINIRVFDDTTSMTTPHLPNGFALDETKDKYWLVRLYIECNDAESILTSQRSANNDTYKHKLESAINKVSTLHDGSALLKWVEKFYMYGNGAVIATNSEIIIIGVRA